MKTLILTSLFLLSACARPDYINPSEINGAQNSVHQSCTLNYAQSGLCTSLSWSQGPVSPAESEFILKFWNAKSGSENGPYVDPTNSLSVVLWMPSMGHGSSPVTIEKLEPGIFRVRRVYFIMPGEWEIRTFLKNGTTLIDQATITLTL
ncbi:MAG: FixH family protein [Bacillota bacterium]